MLGLELAAGVPRNCLTQCPTTGALAVETQLRAQPVQPFDDGGPAVTELNGADDRRKAELTLADERLRVDDEPRLALRGEHVVRVEILVDQYLLSLRRRQLLERGHGRIDELLLERPSRPVPVCPDVAGPPGGLVGERSERGSGRFPEPGKEPDQNSEPGIGVELPEIRAGPATLEQQGMALLVVSEEAHCSVAVPALERSSLVLALAVWPLDLQHRVAGRQNERDVPAGKRLLELEIPQLRALLDEPGKPRLPGAVYAGLGQRYASGRRCESDGSRRRTSSSHVRSSSAEITVSSSGACASTVPQGSTISDRP